MSIPVLFRMYHICCKSRCRYLQELWVSLVPVSSPDWQQRPQQTTEWKRQIPSIVAIWEVIECLGLHHFWAISSHGIGNLRGYYLICCWSQLSYILSRQPNTQAIGRHPYTRDRGIWNGLSYSFPLAYSHNISAYWLTGFSPGILLLLWLSTTEELRWPGLSCRVLLSVDCFTGKSCFNVLGVKHKQR